jgi:hypothetical protein
VSEFAADSATQKQIEKVPLSEDRFDVTTQNVKDDDISDEVPGIAIKEHCRDELP